MGEGSATEDSGFGGTLGGIAFDRVTLESARELRATVPRGLGVGVHDLVITTPDGDRLRLAAAFEVLGPDAGIDAGWPDDAGPPDHVEPFDCSNGNCEGSVPDCPEGGSCPECGALSMASTSCRWRFQDGALAQTDASVFGCDAWITNLAIGGLVVEATVTTTELGPEAPHFAGLLVRIATDCLDQNAYYLCALDYDANELLLAGFRDGVPIASVPPIEAQRLVPDGPAILRASAHSGVVTCEADVADGTLELADQLDPVGSIGFRTDHVAARFDDLRIWE